MGLSRFKENSTQVPYTTLIYGNGPGNHQPRRDPTMGPNSTESPYYVQYAAIHQEEAFHDGSDVAVFASGPYAHLFQGVQEQSYIAHVLAYAMCIGDYTNQLHCGKQPHPPDFSFDDIINGAGGNGARGGNSIIQADSSSPKIIVDPSNGAASEVVDVTVGPREFHFKAPQRLPSSSSPSVVSNTNVMTLATLIGSLYLALFNGISSNSKFTQWMKSTI